MLRFALDQNFPTPAVKALREYLIEAELVSVRDIDPRLARMDDWELLLSLHHRIPRYDGLVTTDSSMIRLPRELCVLLQTKLKLVVAEEAGHDPLKATGLVFAYLPQICRQSKPNSAQIWTLRASLRTPVDPWEHLAGIAKREKKTATELHEHHKLTSDRLARDPLR